MEKEKQLKVYIGDIKYVPDAEYTESKIRQCIKCRNYQYDEILELIKYNIDGEREALKDYDELNLKISHVESEGYIRGLTLLFQSIKEFKDSFNEEENNN